MSAGPTVGETLRRHYLAAGLPADGGRAAKDWSPLSLGPVRLRLPNFAWRREALPFHDLHHVVTGYTCTVVGELEIAAWEFAAGRYPDARSTLFCLPLVGFGAVLAPERAWAAFARGRASQTLYGSAFDAELLATGLSRLRARLLPPAKPVSRAGDLLAYAGLVAASWAWIAAPFMALPAVVLALR